MSANIKILSNVDFDALDPKAHSTGKASARIVDEFGMHVVCIVAVRKSIKSGQIFIARDDAEIAAGVLRGSGKDEAIFRLHFEDTNR